MDITANLVTTQQMQDYATGNFNNSPATADLWCWALDHIYPGGCPALPDPVLLCCGMKADQSNRGTMPPMTADSFLQCLRSYQLGASTPGVGGSGGSVVVVKKPPVTTTGSGTISVKTPAGTGLAATLTNNPLLLVVLGVAAYYLFVK